MADATDDPESAANGAGRNGRGRQLAPPMAEPRIGGAVKISAHPRYTGQVSHQNKHGNDQKFEIGRNHEWFAAQSGKRRLPPIEHPDAHGADHHHNNATGIRMASGTNSAIMPMMPTVVAVIEVLFPGALWRIAPREQIK